MNITVDELWDYFCDNRRDLKENCHMIASDEEEGIEIYVTEERGFPCFSVEVDGEEVYYAETCSYIDAERTYRNILSTYICPEEDFNNIDDSDDDERIREITGAVEDLVVVLIGEDPSSAGISGQEIDEIASIVEQYLSDQCGFSVRHPTLVGGEVVQYPFGDPDEGYENVKGADDEDDLPDIYE